MTNLMKSLIFYPMRVFGGIFILVAKTLGIFLTLGWVLMGVLKLAGELDVAWWIVISCGLAGAMGFVMSEIYIQLLMTLRPVRWRLP